MPAAILKTLPRAELFGHEKGSFTGATAEPHGAFEVALEGRFFSDEIANMKSRGAQPAHDPFTAVDAPVGLTSA